MRVVYIGQFSEPWFTEVHLARDMERIPGVEVKRVTEPSMPRQMQMFLARLDAAAEGADLVLYTRHFGMIPDAVALWRSLAGRGVRTASFHLDLYYGLARQTQVLSDPFWRTERVFTADGDPGTQRWLSEHGIAHQWLPAACVSDEVGHGTARAEWYSPVAFVGSSGRYHPEWPWRGQLHDALARRYGKDFRIWGRRPIVRGSDLNDLYATVPVIVGDSLALPGRSRYWSDRFYETTGRGGLLIGPYVDGITEHFTDRAHLRLYQLGDITDVCALIDHYLDHPDEAAEIRRLAVEHVREHHTYIHRAQTILEWAAG